MLLRSLLPFFCFLRLSSALVVSSSQINSEISIRSAAKSKIRGEECINGPTCRNCWDGDFSIDTDSEEEWPNTGKTVKYVFEVTEKLMAPDGTARDMIVVNGQYPGPAIVVNWGDIVQIDVKNHLKNNGTSFHWHGINQVNSNTQDGANGITECPIPPGATRRYTWQATQHGASWYHSHHASQYGDGVLGTILINGPSAVDYDIDLGVLPITDFYYQSMYTEGRSASGVAPLPGAPPGPPVADNGLINGTNVNANGGGHFANVALVAGKKYRLRLVNTAVDNHFQVSLDQHTFTVTQSDFVPIVPYETDWLFIGIGQRYDVVFTACEQPANYWFRAEVQAGCGANAMSGKIKAIFNYAGVPAANPTSLPVKNFTNSCVDESAKKLVPYVAKDVPESEFRKSYASESARETLSVSLTGTPGSGNAFFWNINNNSLVIDWEQPTLKYVADKNSSYHSDKKLGIIELTDADVWTFWIIQNTNGIPHPIHLHGHDFYILGAAEGSVLPRPTGPPNATAGPPQAILATFNSSSIPELNFSNPTRRDVAMLPAGGWLVVAFRTNNPGAWLMHCHIAWHVAEGLAVQFLERSSEIAERMDLSHIGEDCKVWREWYDHRPPIEHESGL